jgi:hypothetical protein
MFQTYVSPVSEVICSECFMLQVFSLAVVGSERAGGGGGGPRRHSSMGSSSRRASTRRCSSMRSSSRWACVAVANGHAVAGGTGRCSRRGRLSMRGRPGHRWKQIVHDTSALASDGNKLSWRLGGVVTPKNKSKSLTIIYFYSSSCIPRLFSPHAIGCYNSMSYP